MPKKKTQTVDSTHAPQSNNADVQTLDSLSTIADESIAEPIVDTLRALLQPAETSFHARSVQRHAVPLAMPCPACSANHTGQSIIVSELEFNGELIQWRRACCESCGQHFTRKCSKDFSNSANNEGESVT